MYDYRPRRSRRSSGNLHHIFRRLRKYIIIAAILGILAVPALFLWYSRDLPKPGELVQPKFGDATRIYDRDGELLFSVYEEQNRTYIPLKDIPKSLQEATIAIEDKDFYKNKGFSPIGYLRAIANSVLFQRRLAGASTITQQLVKNVLLTNERSLERKIKEFVLAVQVSNRFSKDEILELYLNNIPYGGTAVGVEAAAQSYFGKEAKELDLAESAFLAGLPQSPSLYSPFTGNKYYVDRTKAVLKEMREDGYIDKDEEEKALKKIEKYSFSQKESQIKAPHFVMYVRKILEEEFGQNAVMNGGLQVTTTLDLDLQEEAEDIVKEEVEDLKQYKATNGAALITDPKTGEILAMVGSQDYYDSENDGNFNVVTDGQRQPGSSLKPIIYAAGFEKGNSPATMLMDVKTEFATDDPSKPYNPVNYSGKFTGPVQVRFALGNSLNIPAVKMLAMVGVKDAMQTAYDMGITNWEPTTQNMQNVGLSLVLGGRESTLFDIVSAYGTFANKGKKMDLYSIEKVTDNKGKKLFEHDKDEEGSQAISEGVAFLISHILLDNNARTAEFGSNSLLRIPGKTVAVKTGTTDEKRDNWTIGYTPSYVVGVWVGNNDYTPMNQSIASGVTGASPIWNRIMKVVLENEDDETFDVPKDVVSAEVDSFVGGTKFADQPTRSEYFLKGSEPTGNSPIYFRDFFVFKESDPLSKDGRNRWQEGIDNWIRENKAGDGKWNPPDDVKREAGVQSSSQPTATPNP